MWETPKHKTLSKSRLRVRVLLRSVIFKFIQIGKASRCSEYISQHLEQRTLLPSVYISPLNCMSQHVLFVLQTTNCGHHCGLFARATHWDASKSHGEDEIPAEHIGRLGFFMFGQGDK